MSASPNPLAECASGLIQLAVEVTGWTIRLVFHLLFPFTCITLFGLSYILTNLLHAREFALWLVLGNLALGAALQNVWVAIVAAGFVLAAFPLAWVAYREQAVAISDTIKRWLIAAATCGALVWLHAAWPYGRNGWQILVFGALLFFAWSAFIRATLPTLRIIGHVRANRPPKSKPPAQTPHGQGVTHGVRNEPETI
jgi:hypothetical protein